MMELLAPAGSMESVTAAVQNGAGAVYLGYGDFNARRNAKNFSKEEFSAAVSYCHERDTKVYLTLNTLLTDRELPPAALLAREASDLGADAVLVQDLGVARMLRQTVPDLPLHASTQMTVCSLDGVKECADLGMTRAVLSRELSKDAISYICANSPIEIEVFVHGALCMCYSGQCFFSSVLGGRSGNRGLCAQPCRLQYGWGDKANGYPLSLKDMSLAGHLSQLQKLGVSCIKIEGRMKRPEYVAIVTRIYSAALKEGREPTQQELRDLEDAFSRSGFTDGYYTNEKGPEMFGVREDAPETKDLFAAARASYQKETPRVPVKLYAMVKAGEPLQVGVEDETGRVMTAAGDIPETARNKPLTRETAEEQLAKTGGTPYLCTKATALVEEGLAVPVSALNALRRSVLEELSASRVALPPRRHEEFHPGVRYENPTEPPQLTMSLYKAEQLTPELAALAQGLIYLPALELSKHPEVVEAAQKRGVTVGVALPRIVTDHEAQKLEEQLAICKSLGITDALVSNWGHVPLCKRLDFAMHGDFGLGVYNSHTMKEFKRLGFQSATASFELKFAQIRDLSKALPLEAIVYGRLPLMITENCIIKNETGRCSCDNNNRLVDRKGIYFPVIKAPGCRNEILNSQKLYLADKQSDYQKIGLTSARLLFTTENAFECVRVAERYLNRGNWEPNEYTRGLYYRDVE
ncbi:MAG: DUF3656 domain-containing protein [Oscillospiraceae bacterium]